jgi:endonuclease YncB( thermonuclease family)
LSPTSGVTPIGLAAAAARSTRARGASNTAATATAPPVGYARRVRALLLLAVLSARLARAGDGAVTGEVLLDGARTPVAWTDGDTFRIAGGPLRGAKARLVGVNALETFGPVHRWGGWRREELLAIARASAGVAAAHAGACRASGEQDGYGRMLVHCPEAARALVDAGYAMVFAIGARADPALLSAQRAAQASGAGMWRKGTPPRIPAGVHAVGEPGMARTAYDRIVDTRTGAALAVRHRRRYTACEDVCVGEGADAACLVYVPFERRYRDRPICINVQ